MTEDPLLTAALISATVALMTTLMAHIFTWATDRRRRKDDLEDRAAVARAAKLAVTAAHKAADAVVEASKNTNTKIGEVHEAVIAVGKNAQAAYSEANMANMKIQSVQDAITAQLNLPQKTITETGLRDEQAERKEI